METYGYDLAEDGRWRTTNLHCKAFNNSETM